MKKFLFFAAMAFSVWGAGCSKDAAGVDVPRAEGRYTLPAITASLDDEPESRTDLGTNSVVNWSTNDRIAVVNTRSGKIYRYVLVQGAGTSVGQFKPATSANAAKFDDIDDIKAVYPAVAASVDESTGKISVSVNKEYTEAERAAAGTTSWTPNSSAYAFTHNDIKVSYKTSADFSSEDSQAKANFKFRQLGTWCNFVFNFTTSDKDKDYDMENMESIRVTTVSGRKMISGTAEVDFTDPNQPTLKEGTESSVEWKTTGSLSSATLTKSLMLFPVIDGDRLKVEVKTNLHTFTFYATPSQAFAAGTILRFPFNVDSNFKASDEMADFTYSVVDNGDIPEFIYYGTANCLLLAGKTSETLDITPYKTNVFWRLTGDKVDESSTELYAAKAEVIWREKDIKTIDVAVSGDKKSLTVSNVTGYGNALVGIYNADGKLLWSYHIWKPEIDPEAGLLRYGYTNSGEYEVMPIALGATNKATVATNGTATNETNAKAFGFLYQWGRKDPLGRPGAITGSTLVETVDKDGTAINFMAAANEPNIASILGGDAVEEKDGLPIDYYMIKYTVKNPTHFITIKSGKYAENWAGKTNDHLWGNPRGYEFPRGEALHRSIFDPCPAGYRVAPKDLWMAFTKSGESMSANMSDEANWAENIFNIANRVAGTSDWPSNKGITSLETQCGYFFYYGMNTDGTKKWQEGEYDFYPASGMRAFSNGDLSSAGSYGRTWCSSPNAANSTNANYLFFHYSTVSPFHSGSRGYALPVRCVKEQH